MAFPLGHLSKRFFQTVFARGLTPTEQLVVRDMLTESEARLFWRQSAADQRHAFATMERLRLTVVDPVAIRAALLHDVGKAQPHVGPVGRVVATVLEATGLTPPGRLGAYRRHGATGAQLLTDAGSPTLVVEFARRHPDLDPRAEDPELWRALLTADHV